MKVMFVVMNIIEVVLKIWFEKNLGWFGMNDFSWVWNFCGYKIIDN